MTVPNAAYHYTLSGAARALLPRHAAWWQHRGSLYVAHETGPLQSLWLPLSDGTLAHADLDLTPDMLDLERIAGAALDPGPLDVYGDTLQYRVPYGVVPWVEAIMGCPIRATFQSGSMRSSLIVRDWDDWKHAAKWVDGWADALVALTRMLVERSGGCYAIAQTLMRGPSDLAEAALGPELMCTSMYDHPDELRAFLRDICDIFMRVLRIQMEHWPRVEGGYVSWWASGRPGLWCARSAMRRRFSRRGSMPSGSCPTTCTSARQWTMASSICIRARCTPWMRCYRSTSPRPFR
jgi:hypothetical protein